MNREQYINELRNLLKGMSTDEVEAAIVYCEEYFDEVNDINVVLRELGSPRDFANTIIGTSIEKAINKETPRSTKNNSGMKNVWLIILGILSLPLSLPLLIVAVTMVFVCFILLFVFLLLCVVGVIVSISLFFTSVYSMATDIPSALLVISIAITILGLSLVMCSLLVQGGRQFIPWLGKKISNVLNKKGGKHEEIN